MLSRRAVLEGAGATALTPLGLVTADRAVLWARADRPARLATEGTGLTAKIDLAGLPPGQQIACRLHWQDAADPTLVSEPLSGRFRSAPAEARDPTVL
jgi:alkaline phosphatase D